MMDGYLVYYTEGKIKDLSKILSEYWEYPVVVVKAPSIWEAETLLKKHYGNHITVISLESIKIIE